MHKNDVPSLSYRWLRMSWTPSYIELVGVMVFLVSISLYSQIRCFDIWWHLETGRQILSGNFPRTDSFSYTANGSAWILHEWGSEALFAFVYTYAAIPGLILVRAVILGVTSGLILWVMQKKKVNFFLQITVLSAGIAISTGSWLIRPHLFTMMFLPLLHLMLEDLPKKTKGMPCAFAILFLFWVNLHGGFFIGLLYMGAYMSGECIDKISSGGGIRIANLRHSPGVLALLFSIAATFVNPNGWDGVSYPFLYIGNDMPDFSSLIMEWHAASFGNNPLFIIVMLFLFGVALYSPVKLPLRHTVPSLVLIFMAFKAQRFIPLAGIMVLPVFAPAVQQTVIKIWHTVFNLSPSKLQTTMKYIPYYLTSRSTVMTRMHTDRHFPLLPFWALTGTVALLFLYPQKARDMFSEEENQYPSKTTQYLATHTIPGNIFNAYEWGGYIIQKVPGKKVFIDGRMDVYRKEITEDYFQLFRLRPGWKTILRKYKITHVLQRKNSPLSQVILCSDRHWKKVAEDAVSVLLVRHQQTPHKQETRGIRLDNEP